MKKYLHLALAVVIGLALLTPTLAARRPSVRGALAQRPQGKAGTWVVAGVTLRATSSTKLEDGGRALRVGECVEAKYTVTRGERIATAIERAASCAGDDDGNDRGGGRGDDRGGDDRDGGRGGDDRGGDDRGGGRGGDDRDGDDRGGGRR